MGHINTGIIRKMIELDIPGRGALQLKHLVLDVPGTLAVDGVVLEGVTERIASLQDRLIVHLVTADTHGRQPPIDQQLNLTATRLKPGNEKQQKQSFVEKLGFESVVAMRQGSKDARMPKRAALGICLLSREGAANETLPAADLVVPDSYAVFDLLDKPLRLMASLRK
jgi:soluble P-type ATPase